MFVVQSRCLLILHEAFILAGFYKCVLANIFSSGFHKFSECVCRSKASNKWPVENNLSTSTTSKSGNITKVSDDARA